MRHVFKNPVPKDFLFFNYDSYLLKVLHFGPKLNFIHVLVPEFERKERKSLRNRGGERKWMVRLMLVIKKIVLGVNESLFD
jgi:hypothetical protein